MTADRSPVRLLADLVARAGARPLVTFYDDSTGDRTELSVATFDNWVAKTANLLVDGLGVDQGARVELRLPLHWQTAVWMAACWSADAVVCFGTSVPGTSGSGTSGYGTSGYGTSVSGTSVSGTGDSDRPDVVVCGRDGVMTASADEVVALSLRPWGAGFDTALPAGVTDYAAEVASYGDRFAPRGTDIAAITEVDGVAMTGAALLDAAEDAARRWSLVDGGRLLSTVEPTTLAGVLALLPAALAVDGSVVLARHYDEATVDRRLAGENITARAR